MSIKRYFAVGTRPPREPSELALKLANSITRLANRRQLDGTWGGPDSLDQLVCTTHVAMTMMAASVLPKSSLLTPALDFLSNIDTKRVTTFFWRSGPLLNVGGFENVVEHDIDHLIRLRERAGGNPNYPAPFFLLKLLRFCATNYRSDAIKDVVTWVLNEWHEEQCWYARTSITSMGLALLADLDDVPEKVIRESANFLLGSYGTRDKGRLGFNDNIIDDAFTIYNLYERYDVLSSRLDSSLFDCLDECMEQIAPLDDDGLWASEPPFGGSVDSPDYATAVIVRAALAQQLARDDSFEIDLALGLSNARLQPNIKVSGLPSELTPFWGRLELKSESFCFVAMPFDPRRTEIYEDFVKRPIEEKLGIRCKRVDEITASREIMRDVWELLTSCSVVIADLSGKNPNVFYELGLAHVLGKPVILITEELDDVPFDLRSVRTIIYGNSPGQWNDLARKVVDYVRAAVNTEES